LSQNSEGRYRNMILARNPECLLSPYLECKSDKASIVKDAELSPETRSPAVAEIADRTVHGMTH